jgi:hypothetical protein
MDARSERPATGYGSPEAGLGELTGVPTGMISDPNAPVPAIHRA